MNSYTDFAGYYDRLMRGDFDYLKIADYIENLFSRYDKDVKLICELACGTGNITIPLAARGYEMIGVDSSVQMLDVARKKDKQGDILFLNQNMTKLDLYGTVDAFLCMTDGMNYVLSASSLFHMFKRIKTCFLEPDGLFIFDVSSEYKLREIVGNNTFIHSHEDIFYSWENRYIENKHLSDMFLNFFVKNKNGTYRRFCERHLQRAYRTEELVSLLYAAGFKKVDLFDAMDFSAPQETSERIVFVARM